MGLNQGLLFGRLESCIVKRVGPTVFKSSFSLAGDHKLGGLKQQIFILS